MAISACSLSGQAMMARSFHPLSKGSRKRSVLASPEPSWTLTAH
jgi:hypothetical protein